jgi:acyl-CoA reductase-like NAD-dependent aldehyde dehydrogenase
LAWSRPSFRGTIRFTSPSSSWPALAAGNTIVIKPSEHASTNILRFAELVAEAGIPDGVVNVVTGLGPRAGAALSRHPLVRRVAFTGDRSRPAM